VGLKLNDANQLLVYADDLDLLDDNIVTRKLVLTYLRS
jgi:hypothetical protein